MTSSGWSVSFKAQPQASCILGSWERTQQMSNIVELPVHVSNIKINKITAPE